MRNLRLIFILVMTLTLSLCGLAADKGDGTDLSSLPAVARASISRALGADGSQYFARRSGGDFTAQSGQKLRFTFGARQVELRSGGAHWAMSLTGFGRGNELKNLASAMPQAEKNRVVYKHAPVTEWYENGPAGLEQGFTIVRRPKGNKSLTVALQVSGEVRADEDGEGLTLVHHGQTRLRYTGLTAYDADGKQLPAKLELHNGTLLLHVQDARARYPVVIDPIVQLAKLTNLDGGPGTLFGDSIAISGNVVVVGSNTGGVWVFVKPANGWQSMTETAQLEPAAGEDEEGFGMSVAISGDIILVGAPQANQSRGVVFAFVKPAGGWDGLIRGETAQLLASDGAPGDNFGNSVAISGDAAVVGAFDARVNGLFQEGAAYVFTQPKQDWIRASGITLTEAAKLTASDGAADIFFGTAVAVSGNTIAVGADLGNGGLGEAYVFIEPQGGWANMTETAELKSSDAGGLLGDGIATNGSVIVVTAPSAGRDQRRVVGADYVYVEPVGGWVDMTENAQLLPATGSGPTGNAVAIDSTGHFVLAGCQTGFGNGDDSGQVYVYTEPPGGWQTTDKALKIFPSDGQRGDYFGESLALSGTTMVAGAPLAKVGNNLQQGAAYIFAGR